MSISRHSLRHATVYIVTFLSDSLNRPTDVDLAIGHLKYLRRDDDIMDGHYSSSRNPRLSTLRLGKVKSELASLRNGHKTVLVMARRVERVGKTDCPPGLSVCLVGIEQSSQS